MFRSFISKIATGVAVALGLICLLFLYFMNNKFESALEHHGARNVAQLPLSISEPIVNPLYSLLAICSGITLIVLFVSMILTILNNMKQFVRMLIGLIIFLVLIAVCYSIAVGSNHSNTDVIVSTGLYALYALLGAALSSILFSELRNSIR